MIAIHYLNYAIHFMLPFIQNQDFSKNIITQYFGKNNREQMSHIQAINYYFKHNNILFREFTFKLFLSHDKTLCNL